MKTKEQILEWLNEQPWKGEFYEAVFTLREDLNLNYNKMFLCDAFSWKRTEQGFNVWEKREGDFLAWYHDEPMSWEEYCRQNPIKAGDCYISEFCSIFSIADSRDRDEDDDANTMPEYLCEAFVAYMKLIQLRNAWVKCCDAADCFYKIEAKGGAIMSSLHTLFMNGLSFPTASMANDFIDTFEDLLEVAKPLL